MFKIVWLSLLFGVSSFAGTHVGNSALGVKCVTKDGKETLRLLDYVEQEKLQPHYKWLVPPKKLDYWERVHWLISNFSRYNPKHAKELMKTWHKVTPAIEFVKGPLPYLYDIGGTRENEFEDTVLTDQKKKCHRIQVAIQYQIRSGHGIVIKIDQGLFGQLTPRSQTGLILHEIIYARAKMKYRNQGVRQLTAMMSSTEMEAVYKRIGAERFRKMYLHTIF